MSKTVFYSWQSDHRPTNSYIKKALDEAVSKISEETIVVDRDTQGVQGAVSIVDVILEKISRSDIFLADLSIIGNANERSIVNQNVLFELGYAVGKLNFDNIVLVANRDLGPIETLPFDIRNRRIASFSLDHERRRPLLAKSLTDILRDYIDKGVSTVVATEKYALPKVKPQDYNSYEARDAWVEELLKNLSSREFNDSRIRLHRLDSPKPGLRLIVNGYTEWAMNINYGGIGQDDGISFTLGSGRNSNLYNNSNDGYGQFSWNTQKNNTVLEYHDLSLLNVGDIDGKLYTAQEFADKLWVSIVKRSEEVLNT